MEKFSLNEVIEQAVQTERLGHDFYEEMGERFKNNKGLKELFKDLALKELAHEKTFSRLKGLVGTEEPEGWEEVARYLRAIVESDFFLGKGKSLPSLRNVKNVEDAVKFAIGFEKETLLYYYAIRQVIGEAEAMEKIIAEERSHILWLHEFEKGLLK